MSSPDISDNMKTAQSVAMLARSTYPEFNLMPMTITEGPLKGQVVIQVKRKTPFRFLDLPAELRNRIYDLLLVTQRPVAISNRAAGVGPGRHRYDSTCKAFVDDPPTTLKILLSNKQIRAEATTIVFGANIFEPRGPSSLGRFLKAIGDSKRHITALNFSCLEDFNTILKAIRLLDALPRIKRIHLPARTVLKACRGRSEELDEWVCGVFMATEFKSFLLHVKSTLEPTAEAADVLRAIVFDDSRNNGMLSADETKFKKCLVMFRKLANHYLADED